MPKIQNILNYIHIINLNIYFCYEGKQLIHFESRTIFLKYDQTERHSPKDTMKLQMT